MARHRLEFPARPYVPPAAFLALGACLAAGIVLDAGWLRRADTGIVPLGLIGALLAIACVLLVGASLVRHLPLPMFWSARVDRDVLRRSLLMCGVGLFAGCCVGATWLVGWQARYRAFDAPVSAYELRVKGDPSLSDAGVSSTADVYEVGTGLYVATARMTAGEAYEAGTVLRAVGRVKSLDESDWDRSRFMKGEVASVQIVRVLEVRVDDVGVIGSVRRRVLEAIDPTRSEARALLAGVLCGRATELGGTAAQEVFSRCGLTHLIAVSGSHLAFIAMLIDMGLRHTRLAGTVRRGIVLAVMALYVIFTGCAPSAVRSVLMVGASMGAGLLKRRPHPLSGLSLTVSALVLFDPGIVYDLGFQLSALSVLFLLVFGRYVAFALTQLCVPRVVAEPLALTLVAQWATLPLTVPVFGEISLIAPVANLLVGPLMSALLVAGLCFSPLALLSGFGMALVVPDALAKVSLFASQLLARIPYASFGAEAGIGLAVVAYGAAMLLYLAWWRCTRRSLVGLLTAVALLCGLHVTRWALFAPASVTVLDVGQADAILIRDGSKAVLVDAGVDEGAAAALARNNVFRLDAVVVTHWDRDHWGGLPDILARVPVDRLVVAEGASASLPGELLGAGLQLQELTDGDRLRIGGFTCEAVWPMEPVEGEENSESLCLAVTYAPDDSERDMPSFKMLLTGDAEAAELGRFVDEVGDIDVLKVGHHGSKASLDQAVLDALDPELAVASAGEGNSYGHPDPVCVGLVAEARAKFLCTKDVGDVSILPKSRGITVEVKNPDGLEPAGKVGRGRMGDIDSLGS